MLSRLRRGSVEQKQCTWSEQDGFTRLCSFSTSQGIYTTAPRAVSVVRISLFSQLSPKIVWPDIAPAPAHTLVTVAGPWHEPVWSGLHCSTGDRGDVGRGHTAAGSQLQAHYTPLQVTTHATRTATAPPAPPSAAPTDTAGGTAARAGGGSGWETAARRCYRQQRMYQVMTRQYQQWFVSVQSTRIVEAAVTIVTRVVNMFVNMVVVSASFSLGSFAN